MMQTILAWRDVSKLYLMNMTLYSSVKACFKHCILLHIFIGVAIFLSAFLIASWIWQTIFKVGQLVNILVKTGLMVSSTINTLL